MPKRTDIHSILIIGSGPIVIGQACEFDYSGVQACKVLRREGYRVILVNSNPATIMTDPQFADATYIEPLTPLVIEQIIANEKPDAILPTVGGQTALNMAMQLHELGILERYNVRLLGASPDAIDLAEDRQRFKDAMQQAGLAVPLGETVTTVEQALAAAERIGYPVLVRPSFTLGGSGGGIARNVAELRDVADRGLRASPVTQVLIEQSVLGWKEYELEVMRDHADNFVVVCSIENLDPMGVHTGDSITVAPAMTLTDRELQRLREIAKIVIRTVGVETGGSNIQFAVNPANGQPVVIEMNPRVSRSSALASKATGFPIAKIAALLAVGYSLDEIPNDITKVTPASFEPSLDYVVVKVPRWAFEKFPGVNPTLGPQMKSVGEVMAIGTTFNEAFQKALRGLEIGATGFGSWKQRLGGMGPFELLAPDTSYEQLLATPTPWRIFAAADALRDGMSVDNLAELSGYDPWFVEHMAAIMGIESDIAAYSLDNLPAELLREAKQEGFSDGQIAMILGSGVRGQGSGNQETPDTRHETPVQEWGRPGDQQIGRSAEARQGAGGRGQGAGGRGQGAGATRQGPGNQNSRGQESGIGKHGLDTQEAGAGSTRSLIPDPRPLSELDVRAYRKSLGILPVYHRIDTCAAEFEAHTPYLYSTYATQDESEPTDKPKIMILGGGPNRIGQGLEFDYCCVHACMALRELGYETIMVNCNPETVSTDYDTSDRLYFEPLTLEDVLNIWENENRGLGSGGQGSGVGGQGSDDQGSDDQGSGVGGRGSGVGGQGFGEVHSKEVQRDNTDISGSSSLAASHGYGSRDLPIEPGFSKGGAIWSEQPDTTGSNISASEHSRGLWQNTLQGIPTSSLDSTRLTDGDRNSPADSGQINLSGSRADNTSMESSSGDRPTTEWLDSLSPGQSGRESKGAERRLSDPQSLTPDPQSPIPDPRSLTPVLVQFGGQTPLNLARGLEAAGVPIWGTSPDAIDLAEDRGRFGELLQKLEIAQPESGMAHDLSSARRIAQRIGYPVLVRPSYVLGGRAMAIAYDDSGLARYIHEATAISQGAPVLIDRYLEDAFEVDVDAVGDGERMVIGGIMEHVEEAGVHSGDSAMVMPPYKVSAYHLQIIRDETIRLGLALGVRGLMNVQYAIKDDEVYVLEVNPRSSRTVPFVAKASGVPLASIAAKVAAGKTLAELGLLREPAINGFFVKEAVLPFEKFPGAAVFLSPEMRSTGEVMGHASSFGHAFAKAEMGAGAKIPTEGAVLLTVNDFDKGAIVRIARDLVRMGFTIYATRGTASWLRQIGVAAESVNKVSEGSPHTVDLISQGKVSLVVSTPLGSQAYADGQELRSAAVRYGVMLVTTLTGAAATVQAIRALRNKSLQVRSLQEHHSTKDEG